MDHSKISHYGLLLFVFLLPFQTVFLWREPFIGGEKWQYGTIGVYAVDILLLVILGLALVRWRERIKYQVSSIKYGATEMTLILLVAWLGVSIAWAPDHLLTGYFLVKLLLGLVIFFVARSFNSSFIKKVVFVLLVAGVLQSGIGIVQFLSQQSWSSTLLGMSTHETWQAGSSVLKIDGGRILRAYGTFPHPNMLGGFLAVVLVLGLGYGTFVRTQDTGAERVESTRHIPFPLYPVPCTVYLSSLIIILLGLILTFSRTAWLGAGLGIVALFLWNFFSSDTRKLRPWFSGLPLKTLGILVGAGIVFVSVLHAQIFPRFDRATIELEGSVSERVQSLYDAKTVMDATPLFFGTGAGNFTESLIRLEEERPVWTLQPVHNVVVLILAEIGVIGLFLWFVFLGTILLSWKKYLTLPRKEPVRAIFALALLVLLPSLFLDHWLWSSHFGIFFSFLLLGLSHDGDEESV